MVLPFLLKKDAAKWSMVTHADLTALLQKHV